MASPARGPGLPGAAPADDTGVVSRSWNVALVQAPPATGSDPVAELAEEVAALCADRPDVSMIVYPEIHLFGGSDLATDANEWLADVAEPLDGPRVRALAEIAAAHRIWLIPGSLAERDGDAVYNTAVVFAPNGRLVSAYRKVFPWRPYEAWAPGAEWVTFDVPEIGRFGLSICFDSWFPESTRQLGWLGADIVLNLVKTVGEDRAQEVVLAQANAIVNQVYFLSVNAAGPVGAGAASTSIPTAGSSPSARTPHRRSRSWRSTRTRYRRSASTAPSTPPARGSRSGPATHRSTSRPTTGP